MTAVVNTDAGFSSSCSTSAGSDESYFGCGGSFAAAMAKVVVVH
jgi:hypothetical protein